MAGHAISVAQFHADIEAVADALPPGDAIVNLCAERYRFTVTFFAACLRGQCNLLPSQRTPAAIASARRHFEHVSVVSDENASETEHRIALNPGSNGERVTPELALDQVVAMAFTSGSTGEPQAHPKTWRMFSTWRHTHLAHFPGGHMTPRLLISTVPSWHMYGLEWALLAPTVAAFTIHCGPDFFPDDICSAVEAADTEAVLVSTPVHLRALLKSRRKPPTISVVMSATAPIEATLVAGIEETFNADLFEIYGCSEIGSIASRHPRHTDLWRFFPCFTLDQRGEETWISAQEMPEAVCLADRFEPQADHRHRLIGRSTELVKIAGKRESISHLNSVLLSLPGVEDGVFYDPTRLGFADTGRLGALVVAPGREPQDIRNALAAQIDNAFLPRPLRMVEALPRERTSKLTRTSLRRFLEAFND